MKDIYLINYSVKGIKTLDQLVTLSFYKKIISKKLDTQEYNIKGIYGMNGSGKSSIVTSVEILRNLLINPGYLNNPIVQKDLDGVINKRLGELFIEADYMVKAGEDLLFCRYNVTVSKNVAGKYAISQESLSTKKATSKSEVMEKIFEVSNGEIVFIYGKKDEMSEVILNRTMNLLTTASLCAVFYEKFLLPKFQNIEIKRSILVSEICALYVLGRKLQVYIEESDDHREYITRNSLECYSDSDKYEREINSLLNSYLEMENNCLNVISITGNLVSKERYKYFEKC